MITILPAATRRHIEQGPFIIDRIRPGVGLGPGTDRGFGPLGLLDHDTLRGSAFIRLHEHRNDEIISYLRCGTMYHFDNQRGREALSPERLMVMNAGSGMWHEEQVPAGQPTVEMLQIFLRPRARELSPGLQIKTLPAATSPGEWRMLAAPEENFTDSGAVFFVRSAVWIYDVHLTVNGTVPLPQRPQLDGWLYVFAGQIEVAGRQLRKGDALAFAEPRNCDIRALAVSDLLFFRVNRSSEFTREGTLSR